MSNTWWEIQISCVPDLAETIFWRLEQFGCSGTATEVKGNSYLIRAYIPQIKVQGSVLATLAPQLRQDAEQFNCSEPTIHWHPLEEEDWASNWKQHWQPTPVGDRFIVYPAWLSVPTHTERLILRLDPGSAFGTGTHPTTQLCLESLERQFSKHPRGLTIADLGCGSGILSIGAILLGAQQVYGVDIDPLAVKATNSNRELNQIESSRLIATQGSIETLAQLLPQGFDGIVCNILAEVIIKMIPQMSASAKPNAWGILSGILVEQAQSVTDTLVKHGWVVTNFWQSQAWCCLDIRRQAG